MHVAETAELIDLAEAAQSVNYSILDAWYAKRYREYELYQGSLDDALVVAKTIVSRLEKYEAGKDATH